MLCAGMRIRKIPSWSLMFLNRACRRRRNAIRVFQSTRTCLWVQEREDVFNGRLQNGAQKMGKRGVDTPQQFKSIVG